MSGVESHNDDLVTYSESDAVRILGLSRVTLWRLRQSGRLQHLRVGHHVRYLRRHLEAYLKSCER